LPVPAQEKRMFDGSDTIVLYDELAFQDRFNAQGLFWRAQGPLPEVGSQGLAEIYLHDCLAEPSRYRVASAK
jgi:hypothetical protein